MTDHYTPAELRAMTAKFKWRGEDGKPMDMYLPGWGLISENGLPPNDHPAYAIIEDLERIANG